uniref:Uncharacterized protein n=1 Tax=Arion vulgaris TaxID=1028688 RepID=A0A0B7BFJ2_9EUPU
MQKSITRVILETQDTGNAKKKHKTNRDDFSTVLQPGSSVMTDRQMKNIQCLPTT